MHEDMVQQATEMNRLLGEWVAHLNQQQQQPPDVETSPTNPPHAANPLLRTWTQRAPDSPGSDTTDCDTELDDSALLPPPPPSKRHKSRHRDFHAEVLEVVRSNGLRMASAIEKLADAMHDTCSARVEEGEEGGEGELRGLGERLARVEGVMREVGRRVEELGKWTGETNALLRELVSRRG